MRLELEIAEELLGEVVDRQSEPSVEMGREYHVLPFFGIWFDLILGWYPHQHPLSDPSAPSQAIDIGLRVIRTFPGAPWCPRLFLSFLSCLFNIFLGSFLLVLGIRGIPNDVDWAIFL